MVDVTKTLKRGWLYRIGTLLFVGFIAICWFECRQMQTREGKGRKSYGMGTLLFVGLNADRCKLDGELWAGRDVVVSKGEGEGRG